VGDRAIDEVVQHIKREALYRRHRAVKRELADAERRRDQAQIAALEMQLKELSLQITGVGV
jgi:F0F1-type ATP synthase membrane subunit b/b'